MKRPRFWLRWFALFVILLVLGQYVAFTRLAPAYILRALERALGGSLTIGQARLSPPLIMTLSDVRMANNTPESALTIRKIVVRVRGVSLVSKTLWVESLEIEQPILRISRTDAGTVLWPSMPSSQGEAAPPLSWRIQVNSLKVNDGVVEAIDARPDTQFHGLLDHLSFIVGPVSLPPGDLQTSFAIRGEFVGHAGYAAPLFCSGWTDLAARDLQASCQLEPLALATFEPYLHGRAELRVYAATVTSTSQWVAKANDLKSRTQLELGHLTEGDLSIHGRNIIDVKRLGGTGEPRLSGELMLTGPLDTPHEWEGAFVPGDDRTQALIGKLIERGVQIVKIPLGTTKIGVRIAPASKEAMINIEAASREVQEALELLTEPQPVEAPPAPAEPAAPVLLSPEAAPVVPVVPPTQESSAATPESPPASPAAPFTALDAGAPAPSSPSPAPQPEPAAPAVPAPSAQ